MRDGYTVIRNVLQPSLVSELQHVSEELLADPANRKVCLTPHLGTSLSHCLTTSAPHHLTASLSCSLTVSLSNHLNASPPNTRRPCKPQGVASGLTASLGHSMQTPNCLTPTMEPHCLTASFTAALPLSYCLSTSLFERLTISPPCCPFIFLSQPHCSPASPSHRLTAHLPHYPSTAPRHWPSTSCSLPHCHTT